MSFLEPSVHNKLECTIYFPISSFREYFGLDMYGKWAELEYKSISYPPFACGAGYILSAELVKWIARNRDYLKTFQVYFLVVYNFT